MDIKLLICEKCTSIEELLYHKATATAKYFVYTIIVSSEKILPLSRNPKDSFLQGRN